MRPDMDKVIVERPRKNRRSGCKPKGFQRRLHQYGEDGPPAREGMKVRWMGGTKFFNEHLGPLRRYLDRQVGRPWDKVFSEICAHIDRNSVVQDHVRDHVEDYVSTHVILIDGVLCHGEGTRYHGRPLHESRYRPWFVCPRTGLLRRVELPSRKKRPEPTPEVPPRYIAMGNRLQCRYFEGAWHVVTLEPLPRASIYSYRCTKVDVLLKKLALNIGPHQARTHYGAEVYATSSRKLTRRELPDYPIPTRWWE